MPKAIRHTVLALALGALPLIGVAETTSSGTTSPSATPSVKPTNNSNTVRSADNSKAYDQAIDACNAKPTSQRAACWDAVDSQYGKGGGETAGNSTSGTSAAGTSGNSAGTSGGTAGGTGAGGGGNGK